MLRGLVIAIMAIDHARDFLMTASELDPMTNPDVSAGLFFTRWVTHFCAPVFVLLAGTSVGLMQARRSPRELGRFLLTRGLWLIFVEVVIVSTAWSFAPTGIDEFGGSIMIAMQVIYAIGASMIVLGAAQFMGRRACLALGLIIVLAHNLVDPVWPTGQLLETGLPLWASLHTQMASQAGPFFVLWVYPLVPWIGVMLLGFGTSGIFERSQEDRFRLLVKIGGALTLAYIALRAIDMYGDPNPWVMQEGGAIATVIDFLNTTKYPPSLSFLLMTLGPAAIFCAYAERMSGFLKDALVMFGRVPFAFYVSHLYLLHCMAIALGLVQGFKLSDFLTVYFFFPPGYGVSLPLVYVGWLAAMLMLYPFCKWVAEVKARKRSWWLSYV